MPNEINADANVDTVRDKPAPAPAPDPAPKTTKPVVQSPSNNGEGVDHLNNMVEDNEASKEADQADQDQDDAIKRAVTGANAGIDNAASTSSPRRGSRRAKPVGFNEDVIESDPTVGGAPAKLDSFGRPGDAAHPRPTMSPDLAEPLRDPANVGPQAGADAGETTARLHSQMRAAGARQYGLLGPDSAEADDNSNGGTTAPSGEVGLVTDAHHAVTMIRGKVGQLHQMVNNIGNVASVPVHAIESLMAEINYLMGVVRSKV